MKAVGWVAACILTTWALVFGLSTVIWVVATAVEEG